MDKRNDILLTKIISDNATQIFNELIPIYKNGSDTFWISLDLSLNTIVNNRIKNTNIYYENGRMGLGRYPLYNYKLDIAIPKSTLMTALHIGDGSVGFSLGNGTYEGFIPEIIGIGSNKNDAGLYFVGIAGNNESSNIPLIIFDSRSAYNTELTNRPIMGITSGNYSDYDILIDASRNLIVKSNIKVNDVIINNISISETIKNLQKQIDELKLK
jgi:hypothetical protein